MKFRMNLRSQARPLFQLILLTAALTALTGCMPRHISTAGAYKLVAIDSQNFVLPPDISAASDTHLTIPIAVDRSAIPHDHPNGSACSIHGRWFSFYPTSTGDHVQWFAETPSAKAWAQSGGSVDMNAEWAAFLRALGELQQKGCFVSEDALRPIEDQIASRMVLPDDDALLYHYAFGAGGYVDLAAGMQFQVERVLRQPEMDPQTHRPKNLNDPKGLDELISVYNVVPASENGIKLRLIRNKQPDTQLDKSTTQYPDRELAHQFSSNPHLRLLLKGVEVSGNISRPAFLLGGSDSEQLTAATSRLMTAPQPACSSIDDLHLTCAEFNGTVSVSPKLSVFINRQRVYVPVGTRLRMELPRAPHSWQTTTPATLTVQRKFENQYVDVRSDGDLQSLTQLMLLEDDKISW
jgi:hypothetical protein